MRRDRRSEQSKLQPPFAAHLLTEFLHPCVRSYKRGTARVFLPVCRFRKV